MKRTFVSIGLFRLVILPACLSLAGCATGMRLVPGPDAVLAPGKPPGAVGSAGNIRITVRGQAWKSDPIELDETLLPIQVEIANQGKRPIAVRYTQFGMQDASGFRASALAPFQIERSGAEVTRIDAVLPQRYYANRNYRRASSLLYSPYYYFKWPLPLPTQDMLDKAVHEGVLEPGGTLEGFLYFPPLKPGTAAVTFVMDLADGKTQEQLGQIVIPFQVK